MHNRKDFTMRTFFKINVAAWLLVLLVGALAVVVGGCSEQQFDQFAAAADQVGAAAETGSQILATPGLQTVPYVGIAQTVISGILAIFGIWKSNQAKIRGAVLRSVVKAVEVQPQTSAASIKADVKSNLQAAGIEQRGKAEISAAKAA